MKKIISFILTLVFVVSFVQGSASSAPIKYAVINTSCDATVVDIIDGDSVVAKINSSGEYALVRMIGVDTQGYTPAFEYVTQRLRGNTVILMPDGAIKNTGRWNNMYIYLAGSNFNKLLIQRGYAKVQTDHRKAIYYTDFVNTEKYTKSKGLGIWNVNSLGSPSYAYSRATLNINTATKDQFVEYLELTKELAENIVSHRRYNPFKTIYEIKFVKGMTKEIFDGIRYRIAACTNINYAEKEEFATLIDVSAELADVVAAYQQSKGFSSLSDINNKGLLPSNVYKANKPFISLNDVDKITYAEPDYIVNVNTASEEELMEAGYARSQARNIVEYRKTLSFKNMGEVKSALVLTDTAASNLSDNSAFVTDANNATRNEMKSLFPANKTQNADDVMDARPLLSMYSIQSVIGNTVNRIKDFVYVKDSDMPQYININTATVDQMKAIGLTQAQANKLYALRMSMTIPEDVPFDMKSLGLDMKVSLMTNVNTASAAELKSLSPYITSEAAAQIIYYRNDQPFGSLEEFEKYLYEIGKGAAFIGLEDVLCLR